MRPDPCDTASAAWLAAAKDDSLPQPLPVRQYLQPASITKPMKIAQDRRAKRAEGDRAVLKAQRREPEDLCGDEIGQYSSEFVMDAG